MSANYTTTIDADVMDVLTRAIMTENSVTLPSGQLDRALYVKVNKVLELAGGKWNRSAKAHKFTKDPRTALGMALDAGSIVDEKKQKQQFFTPRSLAADLAQMARIEPGMTVLEPSAGAGALMMAAYALSTSMKLVRITAVEIDPVLAAALISMDIGFVYTRDFLQIQKFNEFNVTYLGTGTSEVELFDRVLMNPPFTKGQDIQHVTHALKFLKPGGLLVSVMGAGIKGNSTKAAVEFRQMVEDRGGYFEDLDEGSFKESGTNVNTVAVVIPGSVA